LIILENMSLVTTQLPVATEYVPYNADLDVDIGGGVAPLNFYSATGLPEGLSMDTSGVITGTPLAGAAALSPYTVIFSVQETGNSGGGFGSHSFYASWQLELEVFEAVLTIPPTTLPQGQEGIDYPPTALSVGGANAPYVWTYISGLPDGMTLSSDGVLSGTPFCGAAEGAPWTIVADIVDSSPVPFRMTTATELLLDVAGPVLTLSSTGASLPDAMEAVPYDVVLGNHVGFSGASPMAKLAWRPGSAMFSAFNVLSVGGVWRILGTPRAGSAGTHSVSVELEEADAYGSHTVALTLPLTVLADDGHAPLILLTSYLPNGVEGENYPLALLRGGGGSGQYGFSATGLPRGLVLGSGGGAWWISGAPEMKSAGQYSIVITLIDAETAETRQSTLAMAILPAESSVITAADGAASESVSGEIDRAQLVGGAASCSLGRQSSSLFALVVLAIGLILLSPLARAIRRRQRTVSTAGLAIGAACFGAAELCSAEGSFVAIPADPGPFVFMEGVEILPGSVQYQSIAFESSDGHGSAYPMALQSFSWEVDASCTPSGVNELYTGNLGIVLEQKDHGVPGAPQTNPWQFKYTPRQGAADPYHTGAVSTTYWLVANGVGGVGAAVTNHTFRYKVVFLDDMSLIAAQLPPAIENRPYDSAPIQVNPGGGVAPLVFHNISGLPDGLAMRHDGAITGTPSPGTAASLPYTVSFSVQETGAGFLPGPPNTPHAFSVGFQIELEVIEPYLAVSAPALPVAQEGVDYPVTALTVSGGIGPYTWSYVSGLPLGMTLSSDGVISGIPFCGSAEGSPWYVVAGIADTSSSLTMMATTEVRLDATGPLLTIIPVGGQLPPATEGLPYDVLLSDYATFSGATGTTQWRTGPTMPQGLGVARLNGAWHIQGTPIPGTAGVRSAHIVLQEEDVYGSHTVNESLALTINPSSVQPALRMLTTYFSEGVENIAYPLTRLEAAGGSGEYSFHVSGLPHGLGLHSSANLSWISGTPELQTAGQHLVAITLRDMANGETLQVPITLVILPAGSTPSGAPAAQGTSSDSNGVPSGIDRAQLIGAAGCSLATGQHGVVAMAFLLAIALGAGLLRRRRTAA
ncbi:MAG: Ig domain-containing protein, partial [Planctomycetes bacterium]|nr:Ig domain-containing protein [Planctomycetota bacterium]